VQEQRRKVVRCRFAPESPGHLQRHAVVAKRRVWIDRTAQLALMAVAGKDRRRDDLRGVEIADPF